MKKQHIFILLGTIILLVGIYFTFAHAHPGRTDSNGGHYVSDTDEYHYHHGYPEHLHPNGICPYSYADNKHNNSDETEGNSHNSYSEIFITLGGITSVIGYFMCYESYEYEYKQKAKGCLLLTIGFAILSITCAICLEISFLSGIFAVLAAIYFFKTIKFFQHFTN